MHTFFRKSINHLVITLLLCLSACGGSSGGDADDGNEDERPAESRNFQAASIVIGQSDFTATEPNQGSSLPGANTFYFPFGNPVIINDILYLVDLSMSRVLGFNGIPTINNTMADFVLGQTSFNSPDSGNSASEFNGPLAVAGYDGKLFITDYLNNRVLIYNNAPTDGPGTADVVVGQADFGISDSGCAAEMLTVPAGILVVADKLIVADSYNHRVLIWNSIPETSGASADIVLGQNSFTNCIANDDNQDGAPDEHPSNRSLYRPSGVWSDGDRLVILDSDNNRVLIWNTFPTDSFTPADLVLGQSDFTHNTENDDNQDNEPDNSASNRTFDFPYIGIISDGVRLIITDTFNNRVLIWDTFPQENFTLANVVLGQTDFIHNTHNDSDQDGIADEQASARTLSNPTGLLLLDDNLIVTDTANNRYLVFELR